MKTLRHFCIFIFLVGLAFSACSTGSSLVKSESNSLTLEYPVRQAREIVLGVLTVYNAQIEKADDFLIKGFISERGSEGTYWAIGHRVAVWLEPLTGDRTKIYVDTGVRGRFFLLKGNPKLTTNILYSISNAGKRR